MHPYQVFFSLLLSPKFYKRFRHLFLAPFVISIGIALYNHSPEAMLYGFLATILFVVVAAYNVTTSAW